jgi:hypothetical protein
MKGRMILIGSLLLVNSVVYADHPYCHANYFFKNGCFFFEKCGTYYPVYQNRRFDDLVAQKDRYREWKIWYHEYPNNKLEGRFYPAKGHYRMYTNRGLSVEHYFQ